MSRRKITELLSKQAKNWINGNYIEKLERFCRALAEYLQPKQWIRVLDKFKKRPFFILGLIILNLNVSTDVERIISIWKREKKFSKNEQKKRKAYLKTVKFNRIY